MLVDPSDLRAHLTRQSAPAQALALADDAAASASAYVGAFCSRLRPGEPAPMIVERVTLALGARLAMNPGAIRSVSAEGQSTDLPPVALTYFEQVLLAPYRRRTA